MHFYHFVVMASALVTMAMALGDLIIPSDTADGIYTATLDNRGNTVLDFLGPLDLLVSQQGSPLNDTISSLLPRMRFEKRASPTVADPITPTREKRAATITAYPSCEEQSLNGNDISQASYQLGKTCSAYSIFVKLMRY